MQNSSPQLEAAPRTMFGKKVRFLRRAGSVPANVFGPGRPSTAIQIETRVMEHLLTHVPRTALLALKVGSAPAETVIIRDVVRKPTTDELYHIDLYRVSMTVRLRTAVPLVFHGEAPAVRAYGATIAHSMDSVEVECLPADIPSRLDVDLSTVEEIDDTIFVRDLVLPSGVDVLAGPDQIIARALAPRVVAEVEEEEPAAGTGAEEPKPEQEASE